MRENPTGPPIPIFCPFNVAFNFENKKIRIFIPFKITSFRKSPYLLGWMRELIADYALALSVIVFSLIGSIGFKAIKLEQFSYTTDIKLEFTSGIANLPASAWAWATLLGFCLSLLFFMDQVS
jgi:hypothetical protein